MQDFLIKHMFKLILLLPFSDFFFAHAKTLDPFETIANTIKNRHIQQCSYLDENTFSVITTANPKGHQFQKADEGFLQIFDKKGNLSFSSDVSSESTAYHFSKPRFRKRILKLSHSKKILAICTTHITSQEVYAEIEMWDLRKQKKTNLFKIKNKQCQSSLKFRSDDQELAWIDKTGEFVIWDLKQGLRLKQNKKLLSLACYDISPDFNKLFCLNAAADIHSYDRISAKTTWALEQAKELRPNFALKLIHQGLKHLNLKIPSVLFNLSLHPPVLLSSYLPNKSIYSFHRHPNAFRKKKKQEYNGYFISYDLETGKIQKTQIFKEAAQTQLAHLKFYPQNSLLIGEDLHVKEASFKSFYVINLKKESQRRFGENCIEDWDLHSKGNYIVGCGDCAGRRFKKMPIDE